MKKSRTKIVNFAEYRNKKIKSESESEREELLLLIKKIIETK